MTQKYIIISILSLIYLNCNAQKLLRKEITDIYSAEVVYHVVYGNQNIKHGSYISFYPVLRSVYLRNNKNDSLRIKEIGIYYFNSKHGQWTTFSKPINNNGILTRGKVTSSGEYVFNLKYGNWLETDDQGNVQHTNYKIYIDTSNINSNKTIDLNIYYPEIALINEITGVR